LQALFYNYLFFGFERVEACKITKTAGRGRGKPINRQTEYIFIAALPPANMPPSAAPLTFAQGGTPRRWNEDKLQKNCIAEALRLIYFFRPR